MWVSLLIPFTFAGKCRLCSWCGTRDESKIPWLYKNSCVLRWPEQLCRQSSCILGGGGGGHSLPSLPTAGLTGYCPPPTPTSLLWTDRHLWKHNLLAYAIIIANIALTFWHITLWAVWWWSSRRRVRCASIDWSLWLGPGEQPGTGPI